MFSLGYYFFLFLADLCKNYKILTIMHLTTVFPSSGAGVEHVKYVSTRKVPASKRNTRDRGDFLRAQA